MFYYLALAFKLLALFYHVGATALPTTEKPIKIEVTDSIAINEAELSVFDINKEYSHIKAYPYLKINYNNKIYFVAEDGIHGRELWAHDPKIKESKLIVDSRTGRFGSDYDNFIVYNNKLYFTVNHSEYGTELWQYDSQSNETKIVSDIFPGSESSSPKNLLVFNDKLFFVAQDETRRDRLWHFDSNTNTLDNSRVKDTESLALYLSFSEFKVYNNQLYFGGKSENNDWHLWRYNLNDNTSEAVLSNSFLSKLKKFKEYDNKLYFIVNDYNSAETIGLWEYENSSNDINLITNEKVSELNEYNNLLFFATSPERFKAQLNSYNSQQGTIKVVANFTSGFSETRLENFIVFNSKLYFSGVDSLHGHELWSYNNTTGDVKIVADIVSGSQGSFPSKMKVFNNKLYFWGGIYDKYYESVFYSFYALNTNEELITITGESKNFTFNEAVSVPHDKDLYFGSEGQFWKFNTETDDNRLVDKIIEANQGNGAEHLTLHDDQLYFTVSTPYNSSPKESLWIYDKFDNSVIQQPLVSHYSVEKLHSFNKNKLFYIARNGYGDNQIWLYDSQEGATELLTVLNNQSIRDSIIFEDKLFLSLYNSNTDIKAYELWSFDLLSYKLHRVDNINNSQYSQILDLTVYNNNLYFTVDTEESGRELWQLNSQSNSAFLLSDIRQGALSSEPKHLTVADHKLFFYATSSNEQRSLWVYDAVSEKQTLEEVTSSSEFTIVGEWAVTEYQGKVIFEGMNKLGERGLLSYDPILKTIGFIPGLPVTNSWNKSITHFTVLDNKLFFNYYSMLWQYSEGEIEKAILLPDTIGLKTSELIIYDNTLFSNAEVTMNRFNYGKELVKVDLLALIDSDGDGLPDRFELLNGLDPNNSEDALWDLDGDGVTNLQEYNMGTLLNNKDSDSDGFTDREELNAKTDPLNALDFPVNITPWLYILLDQAS